MTLMVEKCNLHEVSYLLGPFIVGKQSSQQIKTMTQVFNIYCGEC